MEEKKMNTFVLRKEYALQLPNSYVEIDRDEMEYVDGGYRSSRSVWIPGGSQRMKTSTYIDTSNAISGLTATIITSVTGLIIPPAWAFAAGIASGIISALGNTAAKAESMDKADSNGIVDGWLTVTWSGRWSIESNPYPPNSYQGATF
jgi:hypothetical protein